MFSLIYPNRHVREAGATELLWALLNSSFSVGRLHSVSRTYGGNTLKVEPRELDNLPVVNPLALPEDVRSRIKSWINDFFSDRRGEASHSADILLRRVDDLISQLLSGGVPVEARTALPRQLRLLEESEEYGTQTSDLTEEGQTRANR
jgi:hypothetical protein